jgi:hypothetical protein
MSINNAPGFATKPQGFTPNSANKQKRQASQQQPIETETAPQTVEGSADTALERITVGASAVSDLVSNLVTAAQAQAQQQADAIAAYPKLVDQLTLMYLQERGIEPGKSLQKPCDFTVEIPAIAELNRLLESSEAATQKMIAARTQRQLSAAQ